MLNKGSEALELHLASATCIAMLLLACGQTASDEATGGAAGSGATGGGGAADSGGARSGAGGAGGSDAMSACEGFLPQRPKVTMCVRRKGDPSSPGMVETSLGGPVLAIGSAASAGSCFGEPVDQDAFWFDARDASGSVWTTGISLPGFANPLIVGDSVSAELFYQAGGFSPSIGSLTLRDGSGKLLVYVGKGGELGNLRLPDGIGAARGVTLCTQHDTCGDWSAYSVVISIGAASKVVAYAATETVAEYRITHGGFRSSAPGPTPCPDWYVLDVAIGISPLK